MEAYKSPQINVYSITVKSVIAASLSGNNEGYGTNDSFEMPSEDFGGHDLEW